MKRFMVIYHAPDDLMAQTEKSSPEEMKKGMEGWMKWAEKCGDRLVEFGNPLAGGLKLIPGGRSNKSTRGVVGYSVLQADSIEEAKELLEDHPHLAWDGACEIEVHEAMPPPGQ